MKLRKLTPGDYMLILANLIPVYGVWFEGWNAAHIFLVFCLETIIIGIVNVVKMIAVAAIVKQDDIWGTNGRMTIFSSLFLIIFFIFHYGIFVSVQTQIFFGVSGLFKSTTLLGSYLAIPKVLGNDGLLVLLIFITYYTLQTLYSFFILGAYKTISMTKLMFQPYGRIFIQQFVVIIGSMFLVLGFNKFFIMILVLVKIGFELFINFDKFIDKAEADSKKKMEKPRLEKLA